MESMGVSENKKGSKDGIGVLSRFELSKRKIKNGIISELSGCSGWLI